MSLLSQFPAEHLQRSGAKFVDSHALLGDRVRLYTQTLLIFFAIFTISGVLKAAFFLPRILPVDQAEAVWSSVYVMVGVTAGLAGAFWYTRSALRSVHALHAIETVGTLATVHAVSRIVKLTPVDVVMAAPVEIGTLLLALLVLVIRAAIVPSSGWRTLAIGALATAALTGASIARIGGLGEHPHHEMVWPYVLTWGLIFTAATVIVSRVIYGLQERVRKAVQLGNYTITAKLGEGGMGEVYLAHHALLRRPTAIKLLPPAKAGEQSIARFEREVREASRLVHPNTVEVFDFGRTPDGLFYYAMEYLDGLNLEELVEVDGPQPAGRVAYIMAQVAHALAHAHDNKLIHRDIKPANIVLCDRGGVADMAKVVDFGLVKPIEASDEVVLTGTNTVTGTPAYMAPESLTHPNDVDGRADIYASGAVAYFLLTGEPVFAGATMVEVCGHHLHSEPPPPSSRAPNAVPRDLEALILRCLEKKPEDRFQTAGELHRALLACKAYEDWSLDRAVDWWKNHRGIVSDMVHGKQEEVSNSDTVFVARLSA